MAYEKQNFENGQVLTAENLNYIEEGLVNHTHDEYLTDLDISATQTAEGAVIAVGSKTITLKNGQDGIDGQPGKSGKDGVDGVTPVRGTDYWTEADKAEIRSYVDEAILGGAW